MRLVLFISLHLLWANITDAILTNHSSISAYSMKSVENFFNKYSDSGTIKAADFNGFISKVSGSFDEHSANETHDHDHDHSHSHDHSHEHHEGELDHHNEDHNSFDHRCFETKLKLLKNIPKGAISQKDFSDLSSIFLADLDSCIVEQREVIPDNSTFLEKIQLKRDNWICAFLSAIIITIVGLLCYLVVPSLNTLCFNYLFQFLVALAVGSLTGDALLHLIPHAFSGHSHAEGDLANHSSHNEGVYKGLGAVVGIYVFFIIERIMQIRRARKEKQHRDDELNHHHHDEHDPNLEHHEHQLSTCDSKVPVCSEKIVFPRKDSVHSTMNNSEPDCIVIHANKDLKYISKYLPNNKCGESVDHHDHENEVEHLHQHSNQYHLDKASKNESDVKSISKMDKHSYHNSTSKLNETVGHMHSHGHSHSHKYKSSREKAHHDHHKKHEKEISDIKLIAWMVLMGDGLHNFSDGLAIGASFASSLTAGFGTSIAVLCHELPHEIGDFAVLRRAGVSLRRALVFNLISGVLCMIGTFVGLLIGGFEALSNWTFLFIAGTFLYISLVDMIPELSEDKDDVSIRNFLIQSFGILVGVGIMLAIALLEDKIIKMF